MVKLRKNSGSVEVRASASAEWSCTSAKTTVQSCQRRIAANIGLLALIVARLVQEFLSSMLDNGIVKNRSKIDNVGVVADRTVRVEWADGRTELLDLRPLLANNRSFVALRTDDQLFATVSVSSEKTGIEWSDASRVSSSALQRLPRTQMDAHEFRAIMDDLRLSVEGLSALLGLSKRVIADYRAGAPIPKPLALAMRYLEERGTI